MLKLKVALGLIVLIAMLSAIEAMPQNKNSSAPAAAGGSNPQPDAPASTTEKPNGSPFHGSDVATMITLAICGLIGHRLSN